MHAACRERLDRPFAGIDHAFRPDRRVVLVFDLQDIGIDLHPFAVAMGADCFIRRVRLANRPCQALDVAVEAVELRRQASLGFAGVTEIAHAQTGGVRQVQGVLVQLLQAMLAAVEKTGRQGWRCTEQIHQQPAVAAEIAHRRDITFRLKMHWRAVGAFSFLQDLPQPLGQRIVVMDAGDALHALAIAQRQATPVDVLQHAHVRCAVPGDRNLLFRRQMGRHRLAPE